MLIVHTQNAAPVFERAFGAKSSSARNENEGRQAVKKPGADRFGIGDVFENSSDDRLQAGQEGRIAGFQSWRRLALQSRLN